MFEFPTPEVFLVTLIVGLCRSIVEGSATILAGLFAAAYLRTVATREHIEILFRGDGWRGMARATLVGMALPVCAIGVLPVLRELRKLGLPTSKLLTFGVTAPLLNPITLIYGLSVLSVTYFSLIVAVTIIVALTVSDVASRFYIKNSQQVEDRPKGLTDLTRIRNVIVAASRIATGWIFLDFGITILLSAIVATFLPAGLIEQVCSHSNRFAPVQSALLTAPQYVSPATGVMQLSSLAKVNLSIPAGLALYIFGVGVSGATFFWFTRWYGFRRIIALGMAMFITTVSAAYLSQNVLPPPIAAEEETHGLDALTRPHHPSYSHLSQAVKYGLSYTDPMMRGGAVILVMCCMTGVFVRWRKIEFRDDPPEAATLQANSSRAILPSQIGAVAVLGMAIFVALVSYIYFPGPKESIDEMRTIQADAIIAIRTGKRGWALDRLAAWDATAAKMPVGAAIRLSLPNKQQRESLRALRAHLFWTKERVLNDEMFDASSRAMELTFLLLEAQTAFLGEQS
ncbi:permease [Calycomorphotria hydatis]|uniref:Putative permease n=1 Tax=Calycomorphotria hydatis TaxID=2528027 RepID=A0A517TA23_9PLAN|nr:permease [Calycomorphotria hydatis]QDT65213.1 putative permease [Calycomorphotria hydatis]